jgi:hypothetical protein
MPMRLAAAMLTALLANYTGWALGLPAQFATATLALYLIVFTGYLIGPGTWSAHATWTKCFLLALLLIGLGSVVDAWDARSIWMFHGKRIYLDADLYAQLDGYFALSHNDYPVLVPALAASIARLLGTWNEVAPKLAGMLVWVPALLVILELLPSVAARLLFLVALLTINGAGLIDGMVDMPLALTATACAAAMQRLLTVAPVEDRQAPPPSTALLLLPPLLLAVMSVSKNEGLALAVLLFLVFAAMALVRQRVAQLRLTLGLSVAAFVLAIAWAIVSRERGIVVDLGPGALSRLSARLLSPDAHALITRELIASTPLLICTLVASWGLARESGQVRRLALPLVVAGLYLATLYGVYLSTPNDLQWHLGSSASRILHSVELMLLYVGLSAGFAVSAGCDEGTHFETPSPPVSR